MMTIKKMMQPTASPSSQLSRLSRDTQSLRPAARLVATSCLMTLLLLAAPAGAFEWEGSAAEENSAKAADALLVRPFAALRVVLGAVLMVPASIFSAPGGRENFDTAYEVLLELPIEYAFRRELGDF